jgi:signal transduction histidine kinase
VTAVLGWAVGALLLVVVVRLRRRLELVAVAAHELRGPAAAIAFAVATLRREPGGVRRALRFESELERIRAGLADLDAARAGRRATDLPRTVGLEHAVRGSAAAWQPPPGSRRDVRVRWEAGHALVRADRGRLAQALGNLMANAIEHGSGPIEVRAVRKGPRAVRVEVKDAGHEPSHGRTRPARGADRGRGLDIATRAIHDAGGALRLDRRPEGTTATVELPLTDLGPEQP